MVSEPLFSIVVWGTALVGCEFWVEVTGEHPAKRRIKLSARRIKGRNIPLIIASIKNQDKTKKINTA